MTKPTAGWRQYNDEPAVLGTLWLDNQRHFSKVIFFLQNVQTALFRTVM
jgi:hypothetical protein